MRWAVLAVIALCPGCGDDDGAAVDAGVRDAAGSPRDARGPDARPELVDAAASDAATPDAGLDADVSLLPDLTIEAVERDALYYIVRYCNRGDGVGPGSAFRVRVANTTTSDTFETAAVFVAPAAGECSRTGGITCGLIGDTTCTLAGAVFAVADSTDAVEELDETNNTLVVPF